VTNGKELAQRLRDAEDKVIGRQFGEWAYFKFTEVEAVATELEREDCPNCEDGCKATKYCEGCGQTICVDCWEEHNEDAPCHVGR